MIYPLIVNENGDITMYSSEQDLMRKLELYDVKNNEYECFDASGVKYSFKLDNSNVGFKVFPTDVLDELYLESILKNYVKNVEGTEPIYKSLSELVSYAGRHAYYREPASFANKILSQLRKILK